jgi:hypothetical protein
LIGGEKTVFLRKSEQKRTHPYVVMAIGTLAMIGAFNVVRCTKRTVCHMKKKITSVFRGADEENNVVEGRD